MKPFFYSAAFALSSLLPLSAQASEELAKDYVEMPAVQQMINDMFAPEQVEAMMSAVAPGAQLDAEKISKISDLLAGVLDKLRPDIEASMVKSADEIYTDEELTALIDFYSNETGIAIMGKTTQFLAAYNEQVMPLLMQEMMAITPQIREIAAE